MKILKTFLLVISLIGFTKTIVSAQCASPLNSGSSCSTTGQWGVLESYNGSYPCNSPPTVNPDNYNCHQYIRGALEKWWVSLSCGAPTSSACFRGSNKFSSLSSSTIKNDPKYIRLCSSQNAQAISFDNSDHSVLILSGGGYAAKLGFGSDLIYHTIPTWGAGSCPYSYYAYLGSITISGATTTLTSGSTRTFTISQPPAYATINWTVDTRYLEIQSGQGTTSLTVKAKCGATYSGVKAAYVTVALSTACDNTPPSATVNFNVDCGINVCEGTINGAYMNTVNGVTANYSNTVAMNGPGPYTWTKTSGTTNYWYTGSNGKYLYFSIPSGGIANFNVVGSGCNRTIGFATGWGFRAITSNDEPNNSLTTPEVSQEKVKFRIREFGSGKTLKEGTVDGDDEEKSLEGVGPGFYILEVNGKRKKIIKQ